MQDPTEQAIEEFLEDKPRASALVEMIAALEVRRATFLREREAATDEVQRREWDTRLREVEKQIKVLREERAVTEFVENSIRATVNRSRYDMDLEDSEW